MKQNWKASRSVPFFLGIAVLAFIALSWISIKKRKTEELVNQKCIPILSRLSRKEIKVISLWQVGASNPFSGVQTYDVRTRVGRNSIEMVCGVQDQRVFLLSCKLKSKSVKQMIENDGGQKYSESIWQAMPPHSKGHETTDLGDHRYQIREGKQRIIVRFHRDTELVSLTGQPFEL